MCIITQWSYILSISFMKFHPLLTKLWLRMEKKSLKFRQSKGNNSITGDILMKLHMHHHTMVKYIQDKFDWLPRCGWGRKLNGQKDGQHSKPIYLGLWPGIISFYNLSPNAYNIKAVFSKENYVPPTSIWVGKHAYCSLLCHNDPSIISREGMHKHNFGQTLKLQSAVVTVNIRSRSLKSN